MGTFFEDLSKKISETAETVTNKAGEAVEVQKIRNQIRVLERGNESAYIALGEIIYRHYKEGEVVDSEAIGICEAMQNREESIEKYEQQISKVKGDVKCSHCGKSVAKEVSFCPYCGEKVPDAADTAEKKVFDAADTAEKKASDAADTVSEKVSETGEKIKENLKD